MVWHTTVASIAFYVFLYPVIVLANWLLVLLGVLARPFLLVGHVVLQAFLIVPFRILAKFESLYYFLGIAAVIGLITGACLHFLSRFIARLFELDPHPEPRQPQGHTVASYRAAREKKKQRMLQDNVAREAMKPWDGNALKRQYTDWLEQDKARPPDGLLATTILEEEDSSDDAF